MNPCQCFPDVGFFLILFFLSFLPLNTLFLYLLNIAMSPNNAFNFLTWPWPLVFITNINAFDLFFFFLVTDPG